MVLSLVNLLNKMVMGSRQRVKEDFVENMKQSCMKNGVQKVRSYLVSDICDYS